MTSKAFIVRRDESLQLASQLRVIGAYPLYIFNSPRPFEFQRLIQRRFDLLPALRIHESLFPVVSRTTSVVTSM
jgi:hypothetical protein